MARIRSIKPEFFEHEHLCGLSPWHRLCFVGLWTQADKAGRLEDRPRRLKAKVFPYDDLDIETLLADLTREGFILRYHVGGHGYICIPPEKWTKHQRPRRDEHPSTFPGVELADSKAVPLVVTKPSLMSDEIALRSSGAVTAKSVGGRKVGVQQTTSVEAAQKPPPPERTVESKPEPKSKAPPDPRIRNFINDFCALYAKYRHGANYFVTWDKDSTLVQKLLALHAPDRLRKHAAIMLTTDEDWISGTDRGIGILASRINWLEERLTEHEARKQRASATG